MNPNRCALAVACAMKKGRIAVLMTVSAIPSVLFADDTPKPQIYLVTPTQVKATKGEVRISVYASASDCKQHPMTGSTIDTPIPSFATVKPGSSTITDDNCFLNATLIFDDTVSTGTLIIPLKDSNGKIHNVTLDVVDVFRQPIPPNIAPEVDIMWSLVPEKIVKDSFGTSVGNGFYCLEVVIGNNTGYDLQIASVGFTLDASKSTLPNDIDERLQDKYPSSSYLITRGTLEHGKNFSTRNIAVNVMRGTGTLLTGFIPFFHVPVHSSNYSNGVNVFSNLFIPGFESVFPEETIRQLGRLDGQILRDSFVISNNTHRRTIVFFPKELVPDNPKTLQEVRTNLGNMVIVGDLIRHYERVRVSSNGTPTPTPIPAGEAPGVTPSGRPAPVSVDFAAGIPTEAQLASGPATFDAVITGIDPSRVAKVEAKDAQNKMTASEIKTEGQKTKIKLTAPQNTKAGKYGFVVKDKDGNALGDFSVEIK